MAQPALRIYEMDIPRRDKPESTFHVTFYSPNENATLRGCVIVVHGLDENANRYRSMAKEALVPAGFTLVVPDLPGFGQTPGPRGVSTEEACLEVIDQTVEMMKTQTKGMPIFLYGHSMGGNLALNYLLNKEERIEADGSVSFVANPDNVFHAAIISSPWLKLQRKLPDFLMKIIRFLGGILPKATISNGLKMEQLCNDHKLLQDREQDKLCHGRISFKLLADIWQAGLRALQYGQNLHLPLLLMYGSADQIVSPDAIESLAGKLPTYMNSVRFDGFMHEIHNMQERDAVYETMLEFLYLCLKRGNVPVKMAAQAPVSPRASVVDIPVADVEEDVETAESDPDFVTTEAAAPDAPAFFQDYTESEDVRDYDPLEDDTEMYADVDEDVDIEATRDDTERDTDESTKV